MTQPEPEYRIIPLTRGFSAIVDAADFEWLSQWKWTARTCNGKIYAYRHLTPTKNISMHRFIMQDPVGIEIDHWDGNTLNDRRFNLRRATVDQNRQNRGKSKTNTSGYKGVHFCKSNGKWAAQISVNKKRKGLGYFSTKEEAALAYNSAAVRFHGEFAWLNTIPIH